VVRRSVERIHLADHQPVRRRARDSVATEEPLEIRIAGVGGSPMPVAVTMRTPGADFELAAGFLYGEGVLDDPADLVRIGYCVDADRAAQQRYNVVTAHLAHGVADATAGVQRNFYTTSSCGVCGKASIEAVLALPSASVSCALSVPASTLLDLPTRLRGAQPLFDRTGGMHAAALFDAEGHLLRVREDVGRHNAMDKLVGASLLAGELPLSERIVLVSGRLSFELVQKAARAGVGLLAGVSAPSSLAVELAERVGMTLVGFVRGDSLNVYSGGHRIRGQEDGG
jgi:FdhD protein